MDDRGRPTAPGRPTTRPKRLTLQSTPVNHLAHLLVARRTGTSYAGALLADALRHLEGERYPAAFLRGVRLHHAVDGFTDAHPAVARSRARLGKGARHYRGVLVDVYYDHCLALSWERYAPESLRTFADTAYDALESELARPGWPEAPWVRRMIAVDWLVHFRRPEGAREALRRMTWRTRRPELIEGALDGLRAAHDGLRADFEAFFPALLEHVEQVGDQGAPARPDPDSDAATASTTTTHETS